MEDTQELREAFSDWIRENKMKQYQLKKLIEQYEFWRSKWLSISGINYDLERVQGGTGIDPHMHAFSKMLETEEQIKKVKQDLQDFYLFRKSLTEKQILFFDEVLIKNCKISDFCIKNGISLSRGYEWKNLTVLYWEKQKLKIGY